MSSPRPPQFIATTAASRKDSTKKKKSPRRVTFRKSPPKKIAYSPTQSPETAEDWWSYGKSRELKDSKRPATVQNCLSFVMLKLNVFDYEDLASLSGKELQVAKICLKAVRDKQKLTIAERKELISYVDKYETSQPSRRSTRQINSQWKKTYGN